MPLVAEESMLAENCFQCRLLNCRTVRDLRIKGHEDQLLLLYVAKKNIHAEMMISSAYSL
jgi:hypothetical protein